MMQEPDTHGYHGYGSAAKPTVHSVRVAELPDVELVVAGTPTTQNGIAA